MSELKPIKKMIAIRACVNCPAFNWISRHCSALRRQLTIEESDEIPKECPIPDSKDEVIK